MKIRIEIDENLTEEEIIIRAPSLTAEVQNVQRAAAEVFSRTKRFVFYKGEMEYYLPPEEILFFETDGAGISAHTAEDIYGVKYRLYELEENLPGSFMRVSKSTILNIKKIYAVSRSLSSACLVQFQNTHKQVYVSRHYYKPLKNRLEEKR